MNLFGKTLLATVATATLSLGMTAPATAQGYPRPIPVAAPVHAPDYRDVGHDDRRDDWRDGRRMQRIAVEQCTRAATDGIGRPGTARVTDIDGVRAIREGIRVHGTITVSSRGWRGDRGRIQTGTFSCVVDHGRIASLNYRGIRGA